MDRIRRLALWSASVGATVLVVCSAAGAVVVKLPNGHYAGVLPHAGVPPAFVPGALAARASRRALAGATCPSTDNGTVCSHGGPVLHRTKPYLVFWDPSNQIPTSSQDVLKSYLTDVAADAGESDDVYGVARQYYDTTGFADARQTFGPAQVISDSDAYPARDTANCPLAAGYSNCITDSQIQSELTTLINADHLPTGIGPGAPIYFVVTPATIDVCFDSGDCASSTFCAYHSDFQVGGQQVVYAALPFGALGPSENVKFCQSSPPSLAAPQEPNGDPADVIVDNLSHESNEAITDPDTVTGWWDTGSGNEVADNCEAYGPTPEPTQGLSPHVYFPILGGDPTPANGVSYGTVYDQSINGGHFLTQTVWSNGDLTCLAQPGGATVVASFADTAPAAPGASVSFDPAGSTTAAISSATWSFGDGSSSEFTIGAPATVTHDYAASGDYTVTLTLVDNSGDLAKITHVVAIGNAPTASFSSSPAHAAASYPVHFNAGASHDPNPGATIRTFRWTFGDGKTGTGSAPAHVYAAPGAYPVKLTITDSLGLRASKTVTLAVLAPGRITKVTPTKRGTSEYLLVAVNEAGTIRIGTKSITLLKAGSGAFRVGAAPAPHHSLSIKVLIVYTPKAGPVVRKKYATIVRG